MPPIATPSSSKPSKHICPDCGRAYKAAETLNRHRKNHSDTSQYTCEVCDAAFKRKDLLDRHAQIHAGNKIAINRSRSHRACDRCSRLKTRCDNLAPCTRCSKGGHECAYKQTRSRARTDRSSASVGSSMHGSPHITSEQLNSVAGTLEEIATFDLNPTFDKNSGIVDGLWLEEPAWAWPQMAPHFPTQEAQPRSSVPPHVKDMVQSGFVLDPALDVNLAQLPVPSSMPAGTMYGSIPYEHNGSSALPWHPQPDTQQLDSTLVSNQPTNATTSADHRRTARSQSTTKQPWHAPTLLGSAARIAQEATIEELVAFSTTSLTANTTPESRKRFWQSMSSKLELAYNLDGVVPSRDSNIFEHFLDLFSRFFPVGWPMRPPSTTSSTTDVFPPHLCLVMAAIGAAYAGPKAETFHTQVIDALRSSLIDAALHTSLPVEGTYSLIQSLALLLAAMLYLGHRQTFDDSLELVRLTVELGRKIALFEDNEQEVGQGVRRQVAYGVARLDVIVSGLFGMEMLLTVRERKNVEVSSGKRHEDVLDRLMKKSGVAGKATGAADLDKMV